MIVRIARKECTDMVRDGRFRWAAGIILLLMMTALGMGWKHYRDIKTQHETAQRVTREHWLAQPDKHPHSAAHYGVYVFKPKNPLAFADQGVDPYAGVLAYLEAHKQNDFKFRPAQDATILQRFGELTAAAVLQLLIPLLIVVLSFSAFAGEREQGTLRQLLSLGVAKRDLAVGKALGIAFALGMLLLPALLFGLGALWLASEPDTVTESLSRMLVLALGYSLYFGAFLCLSLAVSAWAKSSQVALVSLLAFWMVNGLVAPRLVSDLSKRLYPTPSVAEFALQVTRDMETGLDSHNPADQRLNDLKARLLKQYNVSRIEDLPVSFEGFSLQEGEDYGNRVFDKRYGDLWDTFERQNLFQETTAVGAPLLAVRSLSMGLSGTDFAHHRNFAVAAEAYRRLFIKAMNDDLIQHAKPGSQTPYLGTKALWAVVPAFEYQSPDLNWVLARQVRSILGLVGWLGVSVGLLAVALKRLRID